MPVLAQQRPRTLEQLVVRAECIGLRAIFIHRFLADCAYFGKQLHAGLQRLEPPKTSQDAQPEGSLKPPQRYRTIFEVPAFCCTGCFNT